MDMIRYLPKEMRQSVDSDTVEKAEEIRLRVGQPLEIVMGDEGIKRYGNISQMQMRECLNYLTGYSPYILEEEMRQGCFTIEGGHRVGISGHKGAVTDSVSSVGAINIRVAHEVKGCAAELIPWMKKGEGWYHTILFSGPGVGKTTCLRDLIRIISSGEGLHRGYKVGLVDERSEIAACHMGVPQNDLGERCDVLDNCPKSVGMRMLLRSMSPAILAVDELGSAEEFEMVQEAMNSGVYVLGTMHAGNVTELILHKEMKSKRGQKDTVRLIEIGRNGTRRQYRVYNGEGERLWES